MVASTYGSVLAVTDKPSEVVENLKILEKEGMGTTLVVSIITKDYILFGNIGDCYDR